MDVLLNRPVAQPQFASDFFVPKDAFAARGWRTRPHFPLYPAYATSPWAGLRLAKLFAIRGTIQWQGVHSVTLFD
jgi:hypothetical protein